MKVSKLLGLAFLASSLNKVNSATRCAGTGIEKGSDGLKQGVEILLITTGNAGKFIKENSQTVGEYTKRWEKTAWNNSREEDYRELNDAFIYGEKEVDDWVLVSSSKSIF